MVLCISDSNLSRITPKRALSIKLSIRKYLEYQLEILVSVIVHGDSYASFSISHLNKETHMKEKKRTSKVENYKKYPYTGTRFVLDVAMF